MTTDDRATYLETGSGEPGDGYERLDLIRWALAGSSTWADPPTGLYERIATEVEVRPGSSAPRRPAIQPVFGIAAALLLALVALLVTDAGAPAEDEGIVVAMAGTDLAPTARGTAQIRETPSGWYVRLELSGLPPAPADAYYEGWLWRDDEGVSIGTFHMRDGSDAVALWSGVSPEDFPALRITLQTLGEGPASSDRVLMRGHLEG